MSYILDALRKSDQQRQRGTAPTLLLAAQAAALSPKRPSRLVYALLALGLLAAGMAIGWLWPWLHEEAPRGPDVSVIPPVAAPRSTETGPSAAPQSTRPPDAIAPAPAAQLSAPAAPATEARNSGTQYQRPNQDSNNALKPVPRQGTDAGALPAKPQPRQQLETGQPRKTEEQRPEPGSDAVGAAPAPPLPSLAELPNSTRNELPPMSIMVHAYSARPAERLVGINNKLLHEGDEIAPGLKLEQITPDGMILNYKGQRFQRGAR
jgi:general secretion pathway protein B